MRSLLQSLVMVFWDRDTHIALHGKRKLIGLQAVALNILNRLHSFVNYSAQVNVERERTMESKERQKWDRRMKEQDSRNYP